MQLRPEARERHVDHGRAQLRHEGAGHGDRSYLPDVGTEPVAFTATARRRAVVTVVVRPGRYVVDGHPSKLALVDLRHPAEMREDMLEGEGVHLGGEARGGVFG